MILLPGCLLRNWQSCFPCRKILQNSEICKKSGLRFDSRQKRIIL